MTNPISNSDDIIDSRDIIERIEELEAERDETEEGSEERAEWLDENGDELKMLEALAADGSTYAPDWSYGETLIRDSYFVEYVEEMLKDIGTLPNDLPDFVAINWEKTADNVRVDYSSIEFDGVTYWIR